MDNKINLFFKNTLCGFICIVLFFYTYVRFVFPVYSIGDAICINTSNFTLCVFLFLAINLFITLQVNPIAKIILILLELTIFVPMFCLYNSIRNFSTFTSFILMATFSFCLIAVVSLVKINLLSIKKGRVGVVYLLCFMLTILTFFTIARYALLAGMSVFNLDFKKVYESRFLLRELMAGVFLYSDNWVMQTFNPFCALYSLYRKNILCTSFFVILQIILFGFSSHKSVVIAIFAVLLLYIFSKDLLQSTFKIYLIYIFCMISCILYFSVMPVDMLLALFHRAFIIPTEINFYYYDYFSHNGYEWFTGSFLRHFIASAGTTLKGAFLIGAQYFGNAEISANTGYLGSGYMQGGFFMLIIYSIIIGLSISIVNFFSEKISSRLIISLTFIPYLTLFTSSDLPTMLLTGGGVWILFLLCILAKDPKV